MSATRGIPACTETDPPRTDFLTHVTENITLPQTSFAGGKNDFPGSRVGANCSKISRTLHEKEENSDKRVGALPKFVDVDPSLLSSNKNITHIYDIVADPGFPRGTPSPEEGVPTYHMIK